MTRHEFGPGTLRIEDAGHVTEVPYDRVVLTLDDGWATLDAMPLSLSALAHASVEASFALDAFGRAWVEGILDDDWRRHWYRSPGGWWES